MFFPQIKPKNLLSSLFAPQNKLQFLVQNKTQKWNHHKPRKNKGIGDGGKVELGARDGKAMKIGVRAISEVREGEVRRRSVRHDHEKQSKHYIMQQLKQCPIERGNN